ncbi:MAG: efflux transporter periplasmic adaptor subunit [Sphingobacteriales bacterium 17-39-43]|uniref:efflux RND transporter periplasmic adaptor subunit n=1 Tax=Daejeonella sp. TaxID=2805397 RepID=UPI000BCAD4B1|nr:efflux RND transporter periplasmic adaptor subunit [Daejeonella sp.]OYZ30872.1 MAG: efflux transporter periplasmic adaptor subunit [Sphingobacteriales bacterium 16-39-50]OYZ53737.1 MAG: efflux transporter periplasmic adaptor subunit [Sphingobacteriales bacterium 24-40-4]OZA23658.1 MAG: efflux transporter periplasmic adaptor subunit [Sphingobacteriales bacterium 17-39-43]HQS05057.1 efflux RND transporter periplasmic adaptor subunit [Daejeonella sp.]HQS50772.1 efflux RND transporter periplasm
MKTKYIVYTILVILLAVFVAYRMNKNKVQKAGAGAGRGSGGPASALTVNGIVTKAENFSNSLAIAGTIEANEQVDIRSEVSGLVTEILFNEGSTVSKGKVLLKINDLELQAQLSQALTKQKLAQETEYRAGKLLEKEAISKEEYDVALSELRSLQSQTQLIRAQLAKTLIRAPFSGKIGLRTISAGEYITPSSNIARLVSTNPVKILFSIPEKYAGTIKINTQISFTVAGSNNNYTGIIYAIEPGIDMSTRTLQLKAKASNSNGDLLPGSFAKIDLPLSNINDAILIPTESIVPVLQGKKVYVSSKGKAKEVMVETGTRTEKSVLILSGLSIGDTVLTTGIMSLKNDLPVKVKVTN